MRILVNARQLLGRESLDLLEKLILEGRVDHGPIVARLDGDDWGLLPRRRPGAPSVGELRNVNTQNVHNGAIRDSG